MAPIIRPMLLPTADQKAAMDEAASPSALNAFATIADIPEAGTGDVTGPATNEDDRIVTFDGQNSKTIQDSGVAISTVTGHINDTNDPHDVTATQVGLGSVDNVKQLPFQIATDTNWVSGWVNRTPTMAVVVTDTGGGTYSVTINITGSIAYWVKGVKYTKTNDTATVTGLTANAKLYAFYDSDTLTFNTGTGWTITGGVALTAIVYFNFTRAMAILYDERHTAGRDLQWHNWAHDTVGPRIEGASSFSIATTPPTTSSINIDAGIYYDEDVELSHGAKTAVRMWYRDGAGSTKMIFDATPATKALVVNGDATPKIAWDNNGTVAYHTTGAKWYVYYLYATNAAAVSSGTSTPIYCVMGQAQYGTLAAAQAAADPTLPAEVAAAEWKLLHILIYTQNAGAVSYVGSVDKRFVTTVAASSAVSPTVIASGVTTTAGASPYDKTNVQEYLAALETNKLDVSLYDANSILAATTDNTPAALTIAEQRVVGRLTGGNIAALEIGTGATHIAPGNHTHTITDRIVAVFDGGGSAVAAAKSVYVSVPWACTVTGWRVLAAPAGTISVDVKRCTYANFPTTSSIAGTSKPNIGSSGQTAEDTNLSEWSDVTLDAGDILQFVTESTPATITWATVILTITRST